MSPAGSRGDHLCRLVDGIDQFRQAARDFLGVGLARRERLLYVSDRPTCELIADFHGLGDVGELIDTTALVVVTTGELYAPGGTFDTREQIDRYRRLTEQALADGYTGLRVAADASAMAATPQARCRFMRYELAVDQLMAVLPMSAMCAYDITVLGASAGDLCAVHPRDDAPVELSPAFRLCFGTDGLHLSGEIDLVNGELFGLALEAATSCTEGDTGIDTSEVTFIDARGIVRLDEMRRDLIANGRDLRLTRASSAVRRVAEVLEFHDLLDTSTSKEAQ